jgi:hypothetical protein
MHAVLFANSVDKTTEKIRMYIFSYSAPKCCFEVSKIFPKEADFEMTICKILIFYSYFVLYFIEASGASHDLLCYFIYCDFDVPLLFMFYLTTLVVSSK